MPQDIPTHASDPHDPMALRDDETWIRRWWARARLYRRQPGSPRFSAGAGRLLLMVLVFGGMALLVAWFLQG